MATKEAFSALVSADEFSSSNGTPSSLRKGGG